MHISFIPLSIFGQGRSSKFSPHAQKVSLGHQVQDDDVVSSKPYVAVAFNYILKYFSIHQVTSID